MNSSEKQGTVCPPPLPVGHLDTVTPKVGCLWRMPLEMTDAHSDGWHQVLCSNPGSATDTQLGIG